MLKKIIVLAVMFIALTFSVPALADEPSAVPTETPTPTPEIDGYDKLILLKGGSYDINNMMYYYHNVLNTEQQKIARFLIGTYNYMYLNSRGFSYENITDLDDFIDKFDEFAEMIVGVDSNFVETNSSRWSSNFQIYIASIISYAGGINTTFDYWVHNTASNLLIPYNSDGLDAWTDFYNDPSNEGVADFGSETRNWQSGITYPYLFGDYAFNNSSSAQTYTNYVLNYSPILYTNEKLRNGQRAQYSFSFKDKPVIDTVYILRGVNGFQYFRYGDYAGNFYNYYVPFMEFYINNNLVYISFYPNNNARVRNEIQDQGYVSNIQTIVNYAFNKGFLTISYSGYDFGGDWYPYISHVVLVDDLNTLRNRQDVYNDYSLGLVTDSSWIKKPKGDLPYWWRPVDFEVDIEKNNGDLDISSDDDFTNNIVNNTVINNYDIIAPGVTINVPVNWFESDGNYLDYTYNYGLPFFVFVGDVFNSLGEIRVIILGVLIFGLVSGVIVKFLQ